MIFNFKYLILPLSIMACINNNCINAMEVETNAIKNSDNIGIDITADKIPFGKIKQIFKQNFNEEEIYKVYGKRKFNIPKLKDFMSKLAQVAEDIVNNNEMHTLNVQDFIIRDVNEKYKLNNQCKTDDYMMDWKQILSYYLAYYFEIVGNINYRLNPSFLQISGYNGFNKQQYNAMLKLLLYTTFNIEFKHFLAENCTLKHIEQMINDNTLYNGIKESKPIRYIISELQKPIISDDKYNPRLEDFESNGIIKVEKRLKGGFDVLFFEMEPIMIDCITNAFYLNINNTNDTKQNLQLFHDIQNILHNSYNTKKFIININMNSLCNEINKINNNFYKNNKDNTQNYNENLHYYILSNSLVSLRTIFYEAENDATKNEFFKIYCKQVAKDIDSILHNNINAPKSYGITDNIYKFLLFKYDYIIESLSNSFTFGDDYFDGRYVWKFLKEYIKPLFQEREITTQQYQSLLEYCFYYCISNIHFNVPRDRIDFTNDDLFLLFNNIIEELVNTLLPKTGEDWIISINNDLKNGKTLQSSFLIDNISNKIIQRIIYFINFSNETSYKSNIIEYLFNGEEINEKTVDEKFNITKIITEQLKNSTEYSKYYLKCKDRFDLNTYINVFRGYDKIDGNKNSSELSDSEKIFRKTNLSDNHLNTVFHFLMSQIQVINALSTYIPNINCNNQYNTHTFSQYIDNIIEYYNTKFKQLIQRILKEELDENNINILKNILQATNINRETTINDIISKEQKLIQQIELLENINYNMKHLNIIIDSVDIFKDFVEKINKEDSSIMNLTLQELISRNQDPQTPKTIKRIPIQATELNSYLEEID